MCSCEIWDVWKEAIVKTSVQYMHTKTKKCPHCQRIVEKGDGCNHMTCICSNHFCWQCGEKLQDTMEYIATHTYGKYVRSEDEQVSSEDELVNSEMALARINYYHNIWLTHNEALMMEKMFTFEPLFKYLETTSADVDGIQVLLDKAHSTLIWTRRALANSYPFACYMFDKNVRKERLGGPLDKDLFENKQNRLATIVKSLSDVLQKFNRVGYMGFMTLGEDAQKVHDQIIAILEEVKHLTQHADLLSEQLYVVVIKDLISSLNGVYHYVQPYNVPVKATPFNHNSQCHG